MLPTKVIALFASRCFLTVNELSITSATGQKFAKVSYSLDNLMIQVKWPTNSIENIMLTNRSLHHKGQRRHNAIEPCIQLAGPLQDVVLSHSSKHHPLGRGHQCFRFIE